MSKYRKVDPRILNDAKLRSCQEPTKALFIHLLIHPHMTPLGAMRATQAGLGEELGDWWPSLGFPDAIRDAIPEASSKGLIEYDPEAKCIALPKFLHYNRPESINVVKAWAKCLDDIPESRLKLVVLQRAVGIADGMGDAFKDAIPDAMRDAIADGIPDAMPDTGAGAGTGAEDSSASVQRPATSSWGGPPDGDWRRVIEVWNKACSATVKEPYFRFTSDIDRRNAERIAEHFRATSQGDWQADLYDLIRHAFEGDRIYGKPRHEVTFGFFMRDEVWKSVVQGMGEDEYQNPADANLMEL